MLQDMDHMEASFVIYVKVGIFPNLEQSQNEVSTINKTRIIRQSTPHDSIATFRFMLCPNDSLRLISADVLSLVQ